MTNLFEYVRHPHVKKRRESGPPTKATAADAVHGTGRLGRLNKAIGVKITAIVGTMYAAYIFIILALISAPSAFSTGDKLIIVAWIAQTFLQLVLLPIIIVGQNVQAESAEQRAQATYDDASAVLEEAKQIQAHMYAQDAQTQQILAKLTEFTTPPNRAS
jgi:hypothetical protein